MHWSRIARTQRGSIGRAPGAALAADDHPVDPGQVERPIGPSSGSTDRKRTPAGASCRWRTRGSRAVLDADAPPDVRGPRLAPYRLLQEVAHQRRALGQHLVGVPVGRSP